MTGEMHHDEVPGRRAFREILESGHDLCARRRRRCAGKRSALRQTFRQHADVRRLETARCEVAPQENDVVSRAAKRTNRRIIVFRDADQQRQLPRLGGLRARQQQQGARQGPKNLHHCAPVSRRCMSVLAVRLLNPMAQYKPEHGPYKAKQRR